MFFEPPVLRFMACVMPVAFVHYNQCLEKNLLALSAAFEREEFSPENLAAFARELRKSQEGYGDGIRVLFEVSSPFNCMAEMVEFQMRAMERSRLFAAAVAVEKFRRATGALPERLDELVPGYLATVPLSLEDGEPVVYERGKIKPYFYDDKVVVEGYKIAGSWHVTLGSKRPRRTSVVVGKLVESSP